MANTLSPEARKEKKRQRLRHKEQMLATLRTLFGQNAAAASFLSTQLPPAMAMGPTPAPVNVNMAFDGLRTTLQQYFQTQGKYLEQLIKDMEMEIELMRKYDE